MELRFIKKEVLTNIEEAVKFLRRLGAQLKKAIVLRIVPLPIESSIIHMEL